MEFAAIGPTPIQPPVAIHHHLMLAEHSIATFRRFDQLSTWQLEKSI
jgi:hypothetical protein